MSHDPEVSPERKSRGVCAEQVCVWAYAGRVVLETDDGQENVAAHLSVSVARDFLRNVQAAIDAAVMLGG